MTRCMTPSQQAGQLENELWLSATATSQRWETIRHGEMQAFVMERLKAAVPWEPLTNTNSDQVYWVIRDMLGPEWYPTNSDHPFPCWCRDMPEGPKEILIELWSDLGLVLVHPTLLADYLVAFDRTHLVEGLCEGRYLSHLRAYEGPGGELFRRPFVYHGPNQGWSAGEIRMSFTMEAR